MNIPETKPIESLEPDDLSLWEPAEALVRELLHIAGGTSDPLLKMLAYIKRRISADERFIPPVDLEVAIQNLIVAAYRNSEGYYERAEQYADSLLTPIPHSAEPPAPTSPVDFQTLAKNLADLIDHLPESVGDRLRDAAVESINQCSGINSLDLIRGCFARACVHAAEAEDDQKRCLGLTDRQKKLRTIMVLALESSNQGPSDESLDAVLQILEQRNSPD